MRIIELHTMIRAPIGRVFDLSRSIEFHQDSTVGTAERAVAGTTARLIQLGEQVTWEARHLGFRQRLTARISRMEQPHFFQDIMVAGAFKHMTHDHRFESHEGGTLMHDRFEFSAPLGPLGWIAESLFLERYMRRFLLRRNAHLKRTAESDAWRRYLPATNGR